MTEKCAPFFKKHIYITEYSPERLYYIFRNNIITINHYKNKFPDLCKIYKKFLFLFFIKFLLYEKNKFAKLKMALHGFWDARKNGKNL